MMRCDVRGPRFKPSLTRVQPEFAQGLHGTPHGFPTFCGRFADGVTSTPSADRDN